MTFLPTTGGGGLVGWRVLEKTAPAQQAAFERTPSLNRNIDYFLENVGKALTPKDLVSDYRLLTVALGAFGLGEEINNRGLVLRMLEGGTEDEDALANRFTDTRYKAFVKAFSYGNIDGGLKILTESFQNDIVARYKALEFERAVGEVDNDMRLAMNFKREIADIANGDASDVTKWFQVMGNRPLREVVATALNIPTEVAQLDVDKQQEIFADRANQILGDSSVSALSDPENIDLLIRRFFLNRQIEQGPSQTTPGYAALTMLQSTGLGASSISSLILSQATY